MTNKDCTRLLTELVELKRRFGGSSRPLEHKLRALGLCRFKDAGELVQLHEALLFVRAYPPNASILKQVEAILKTFPQRVSQLREADADFSPLDDPEVSGISGASVTSNFSYAIVCWLAEKYPSQLAIDWEWFEEEERFGATLPRFLPLLAEDAMVEAHVPCRVWLRASRGRANEVVWLIERFKSLKKSEQEKAELYDSLKIHVTWTFGLSASRTLMKLPPRRIFYHRSPLIPRRDVSFSVELARQPAPVTQLSRAQGKRILDLARETSALRYRELHGFTFGDVRRVLKADLGRGAEAFVLGVPRANRLPLRAYHAALILKNGVPVGYFEGLSIFERMESGFNLYYTFREGETAWLYARILRLMRQLLGVSVFSIDPYQVGHENEEGIESGAFWFYRKLGFRPVLPELTKLMLSEERRMKRDSSHRTAARTLRRLAAGHMLYEMPGEDPKRMHSMTWNRFHIRNVGLAVNKRMALEFGGDARKISAHSINFVERTLGLVISDWPEAARAAAAQLALVLATISMDDWTAEERQLAAQIIRAKATRDEARYLKLMQKHPRLRAAVIRLGQANA